MTASWLTIAIVAQFVIASSAVFDKLLLKKRSIEPWAYTFWLGIIGGLAVFLLPFGFEASDPVTIALAIVSGILFIGSSLAVFAALEVTEVSEALPIMGALIPVFTLVLAGTFIGGGLGGLELIGFSTLITSGVILAFAERTSRRSRTVALTTAASLLAAAATVAAKIVFNETNFITGFFWIKIGGVLAVLAFLGAPRLRAKILAESAQAPVRSRMLYFCNRGYAGLGSLLVYFAISLGQPALVETTANFRYLVIFVLGALLLHERFRGRVLAAKVSALALIAAGLLILGLADYARRLPALEAGRPIEWGLTYSAKFSRELGLDPRQTLDAILTELQPPNVRLVAYWDDIEPVRGRRDFSDLDWQLESVRQAGAEIILVTGLKVPRWPECHVPPWASALDTDERESTLRAYLSELIRRYRGHSEIIAWQIENEPYLPFGKCHDRGQNFLREEIALVKSLDSGRPVLTTDGGEFGLWVRAARHGDLFGTTIYRRVYPRFIGPLFGVVEYPIAPNYFRVKERMVKWWNHSPEQRFIVSELQGEPWFPSSLAATRYEDQTAEFSPEYFRDTIEYAKAAGFDEYYLWGAEWWYWMKETHGDRRYWNIATGLFAGPSR